MDVAFDSHYFRRREITIQAVRRSNHCTEEALQLIEEGKVACQDLITHSFPLERTEEAFRLVADYGDGVMKAVIE